VQGALPELVIEIRDDGIGIDPEVLPRIFDAFEQGERSRTRLFGGLGLGLAISRALVDLHGGTLTASSGGRDCGATFTVRLQTEARPEEDVLLPAGTKPTGALSEDGQRPLRILLVEDHPDTAAQISRLLKRSGHTVTWAGSLREARSVVAAAHTHGNGSAYDLVVSDLGLPDGNGHELMRELSGTYGLTGIALSGYGMEADLRQSAEAGFARHLTKPVDWQDLKNAIQRLSHDMLLGDGSGVRDETH
jgi:two-component system CheB/CheR fusion protein